MPVMFSVTSLSELASDEHAVSSVKSSPSDAGAVSGQSPRSLMPVLCNRHDSVHSQSGCEV